MSGCMLPSSQPEYKAWKAMELKNQSYSDNWYQKQRTTSFKERQENDELVFSGNGSAIAHPDRYVGSRSIGSSRIPF